MHTGFTNTDTDANDYADTDADDNTYSNSHTHPYRFLSHYHRLERRILEQPDTEWRACLVSQR